jgi:3-dehydroquinate synthase class II
MMKKLILNFEKKGPDFKELVQEAFNKDILNFLVSKETFSEFENIERINVYSKDLEISPKYRIYTDKAILNEVLGNGIPIEDLGFFKELKSKDDEVEIKDLSKTGQVDFIIVSAKDWKIILEDYSI